MRTKRSGFSLVLSLTIMAAMVMMVIVLASFLQVESRLAQSHSGYLRARYNAIASARIAIGQLQQLAGPDQRVTMRADMFSPEVTPPGPVSTAAIPRTGVYPAVYNPNSPLGALGPLVVHQKRYLTGVWATGGVQSNKVRDWDVTDPHNTRLFLGWLCSPMYKSVGPDFEIPDTTKLPNLTPNRSYYNAATGQAIMTESQALIDDLITSMEIVPAGVLVPLVSSGTVSWPPATVSRLQQEYYGAVDMRPVPLPGPTMATGFLGANGRYAFWVGDEGIKAKINLPDAYAKKTDGTNTSLINASNWEKELGGSAAQRNGIEAINAADRTPMLPTTFQADFKTWRDLDIKAANLLTGTADSLQLPKVFNAASLAAWATKVSGSVPASLTMDDGMRALWRDVTAWSFSTLTDNYNGGLKYDLSTAFELPYATYRGLEIYADQKNLAVTTNDNRRPSLFHNAPGYADLDFNRPNLVDKIASDTDLLAAYPRASEWTPRYTAGLLGPGYTLLKNQNGGETPERMGFVYEVPLGSRFFDPTTSLVGGTFSRLDTTTTQPTFTTPTTPVRIHSLPWAQLDKDDVENIKGRIVRGPTWDLYRNYYRMYKREIEAANTSTGLMGQAPTGDSSTLIARGLEPLTFASGNRVTPVSKATDVDGKLKKYTEWPLRGINDKAFANNEQFYLNNDTYTDFFYRNNLSDTTFGPDFQADKRIFQPFNILTPSNNIQWSYGGVNNVTPGVFGTYEHSGMALPSATSSTGARPDSFYDLPKSSSVPFSGAPSATVVTTNTTTRTWPTSMNIAPSVIRFAMVYSTVWNQDMLGIVVDPYITLHNPYDCAIEFEGIAMVSNDQSMTYKFTFEVGGNAPNDFSSTRWDVGDLCLSQSTTDGRELSMRAVAGINGTTRSKKSVLRLEPGEVRIVSPSQASRRNNLDGTSPVAIPGDLVFEQQSRMFFPMNTYVGMKRVLLYTLGKPTVLTEDFTDDQISKESPGWNNSPPNIGALLNKWWMENARRTARTIKIQMPGWKGDIPSMNAELARLGKKPFVKFRNFGWTDWSGYIVAGTSRATNATTGMDGNLHYNFYLLNQKSAKQLRPLNWERRWSGGRDTRNVGASFRLGEDTPHLWWAVDQPLLLNLQTLSAGWPLFGNSNRGFVTDPDDRWLYPADTWDFKVRATGNWGPREDPEFKRPLIYYDGIANSVNESQLGKLPCQGPSGENLATWSANGANITKQPVLLFDMLVRGAKESAVTASKWYPPSMTAWPNYQPGATDTLRAPDELKNAPMNPFFMSTRSQQAYLFGYDGKAHGPVGWITRQIPVSSAVLPIDLNGDNAFWGASVEASTGGQNNVILFPIPRRPLLSLSQLGTVAFAQTNTDPDFTVGSSFAHPGIIDLTKIIDWPGPKVLSAAEKTALSASGQAAYWIPEHGFAGKSMGEGTIRNRSNVRTDHAFAANLTLWDSYFFSGLNLAAPSYSSQASTGNWPKGPNMPTDATVKLNQETYLKAQGLVDPTSFASLKTALDAGSLLLANKRVAYAPDFRPASATFPKIDEFPHPAFLASRSLYNGGFNVNSTSKPAWKAILSGMKGQLLPNANGSSTSTALTKFARAMDSTSANGSVKPWASYRELNDNEIDALAAAVVLEVRRRGPFMSLADFINRRLINNDTFGLKGALQAAIDSTDNVSGTGGYAAIANGGNTYSSPVGLDLRNYTSLTTRRIPNYPADNPWNDVPNIDRFPSLRAMSTTNDKTKVTAALGAPGIVTQMDVLNSIGPNLTARSDTFVVRAYGEALDNAGNTIGRAWVEVVVQRSADYIGPAGVDPNRRKLAYRGVDSNAGDGTDKDPKVINETKAILEKFERRTVTPAADAANLNRLLGRRFKTVNLRWLSASEI